MRSNNSRLLVAVAIAAVYPFGASADDYKEQGAAPAAEQAQPAGSADMAEGEVRKVDRDNKKITLKHGEIKSLDMPPMTMVFRVGDAGMLEGLQPGDRVKFKAALSAGSFVVTEIRQAR